MEPRFPIIWYATPEKICSATKWVVFSDRGSLECAPGAIRFQGKQEIIDVRGIAGVTLVRQRLPWKAYIFTNIVTVVFCAAIARAQFNLVVLTALLVAGNLFGILVGACTKWVEVEYRDESGHTRKAYFADASMFGWGGLFGGTSRLFRVIENQKRVTSGA